jgi:hypothetical protein
MRNAVRILVATIVATAGVSCALSSANADARLWDGTVVVTSVTPQCQPLADVNGTLRAIYRPRLKAGDPKAAIIVQTNNLSHIYVVRAQTNTSSMNGTGEYCGIDFDPGKGESSTWFGGHYDLTVSPANMTQQSPPLQVRVTGKVTKFGNIPGCTVVFRGAFLRRP